MTYRHFCIATFLTFPSPLLKVAISLFPPNIQILSPLFKSGDEKIEHPIQRDLGIWATEFYLHFWSILVDFVSKSGDGILSPSFVPTKQGDRILSPLLLNLMKLLETSSFLQGMLSLVVPTNFLLDRI